MGTFIHHTSIHDPIGKIVAISSEDICKDDLSIQNHDMDSIYNMIEDGGRVFIENRGQVDNRDILFYTYYGNMVYGFQRDGFLIKAISNSPFLFPHIQPGKDNGIRRNIDYPNFNISSDPRIVKISFRNSKNVLPAGLDPASWTSNHFKGKDPAQWKTNVRNFRCISYDDLWDGVDLTLSMENGLLKYDITLHPFSKPSDIVMEVDGTEDLVLSSMGTLNLIMNNNKKIGLVEESAEAFYADDDDENKIFSRFVVNDNSYSFHLGEYDNSRSVIVKQEIYSTFIGGGGWEDVWDFSVDDEGCIYMTRFTDSANFPTTNGSYDETYNGGDWDVFVVKINASGTSLDYCTFIGGYLKDVGSSIDIDNYGCAYITGFTDSPNFPVTKGAFDITHNGTDTDIFILKLNAEGNRLKYSTFLGGSKYDGGYRIAVDDEGCAYITGETESTDFPATLSSFSPSYRGGGFDSFLTKLSSSGDSLIYSTYLGGSDDEAGFSIYVDGAWNVYVFGETSSTDFPTSNNSLNKEYNGGEMDAFIIKLNSSGETLDFSTYLGGKGNEYSQNMVLDTEGRIYLIGGTNSEDFPTTDGAYDRSYNGGSMDAYIVKLNNSGDSMLYSTFFGGRSWEAGYGIDVDHEGYVYLTGTTWSTDFPTTRDADNIIGGPCDAFVSKLNIPRSSLVFSSYLGGESEDQGRGIKEIDPGHVDVIGYTKSTDFPTVEGSFDTSYNGGEYDLFASRMSVLSRPSKPVNVTAISGNGYINISWQGPIENGGTSSLNFKIYRGVKSNELKCKYTTYDTFINDTGLSNGVKYYYKVYCENIVGMGPPGKLISAIPGTVPGAPWNLTSVWGNRCVNLTWSPPDDDGGFDIIAYNIYRGESSESLSLILSASGEPFFSDNEVKNGRTYYYRISAINVKGEGAMSEIISSTPGTYPGTPEGLTLDAGDGSIKLSWKEVEDNGGFDIEGYRIYKGDAPENLILLAVVAHTLTYSDTVVSNGVTYYYSISAFNIVGEGCRSPVINSTPGTHPGQVKNLSALSGDSEVFLTWEEPEEDGGFGITNYIILKGSGPEDLEYLSETNDSTSYRDTDIENGRIYYYSIRAVNERGAGPPCAGIHATPATVPGPVRSFAAVINDRNVFLSWNPPMDDGGSPITGYRIFRGTCPEDMMLLVSTPNVTVYCDSLNGSFNVFFYEVRAMNNVGEGPASEMVNVTRNETISVKEQHEDHENNSWIFIILSSSSVILVLAIIIIIVILFKRKNTSDSNEQPGFDWDLIK